MVNSYVSFAASDDTHSVGERPKTTQTEYLEIEEKLTMLGLNLIANHLLERRGGVKSCFMNKAIWNFIIMKL